jgi:hypothetical protein
MKIVVDQPVLREALQRRHINHSAEGLGSAEAEVVEQDHDHVGRTLRHLNLEQRRCRGLANVELRDRRVFWFRQRQRRTVDRGGRALPGVRRRL